MFMFSVIIPCFNSFQLMKNCLKSLELQTFRDFEVIIVDDGSTDGTYEWLLDYCSTSQLETKLFRTKSNSGPGYARNVGLESAAGDYVIFLDADDHYSENCLERLKEIVVEYDADCVIFDYFIQKDRTTIKRSSIPNASTGIISRSHALVFTNGGTACKTYRRELLLSYKVRFAHLRWNEDMPFTKCAISVCPRIYYLRESLYYYVMHGDSLMHNVSLMDEENAEKAFELIERRLKDAFPEEIEALFVREYLFSTTMILSRKRVPISKLRAHIRGATKRYPNWRKNRLLGHYPIHVRVWLLMIHEKRVWLLYVYRLFKNLAKVLGLTS